MKGISLFTLAALASIFTNSVDAKTSVILVEDGSATGQKAGYELKANYWVEDDKFKIDTVLKVPYPTSGTPVYSTYLQWSDPTTASV